MGPVGRPNIRQRSPVLDPISFGVLLTPAVTVTALRGDAADDDRCVQVDLQVLDHIAGYGPFRTPGAAISVHAQPVRKLK